MKHVYHQYTADVNHYHVGNQRQWPNRNGQDSPGLQVGANSTLSNYREVRQQADELGGGANRNGMTVVDQQNKKVVRLQRRSSGSERLIVQAA